MKRMLLRALVVATLVLPAASHAGGLEDGYVVAQWTCGAQSRPSQRQVADWFGLANFDQVYDVRARTHRALLRACKGGATSVDIVLKDRSNGTLVIAIAAR